MVFLGMVFQGTVCQGTVCQEERDNEELKKGELRGWTSDAHAQHIGEFWFLCRLDDSSYCLSCMRLFSFCSHCSHLLLTDLLLLWLFSFCLEWSPSAFIVLMMHFWTFLPRTLLNSYHILIWILWGRIPSLWCLSQSLFCSVLSSKSDSALGADTDKEDTHSGLISVLRSETTLRMRSDWRFSTLISTMMCCSIFLRRNWVIWNHILTCIRQIIYFLRLLKLICHKMDPESAANRQILTLIILHSATFLPCILNRDTFWLAFVQWCMPSQHPCQEWLLAFIVVCRSRFPFSLTERSDQGAGSSCHVCRPVTFLDHRCDKCFGAAFRVSIVMSLA